MIAYILSLIVQVIFAFQPVGVSPSDCECDQDYCHVCESAFRNDMRVQTSYEDEELDWFVYNLEAQTEYAAEFTALFNSYETKRASNGRLMIRQGDSGSFKFAKKG